MIRAIIFDLYGVLALNGWQAFKQKHFANNQTAWQELYHLGRQVDAGQADYENFIEVASKLTGVTVGAVRAELEHSVPNEELFAFIEQELKPKYKIGMLSNASINVPETIFSTQQRDLFDAIVLSFHVGFTKPDREMYFAVAEKLELRPEECLFIDDQERHCDGALRAGMSALQYQDFEAFKRDIKGLLEANTN